MGTLAFTKLLYGLELANLGDGDLALGDVPRPGPMGSHAHLLGKGVAVGCPSQGHIVSPV